MIDRAKGGTVVDLGAYRRRTKKLPIGMVWTEHFEVLPIDLISRVPLLFSNPDYSTTRKDPIVGESEEYRPFLISLMAAKDIPSEAQVTKRTGDKLYTLKRNITLYTELHAKVELAVGVFLFDDRANINAVDPETLLLWYMTRGDAMELIDPEEDK